MSHNSVKENVGFSPKYNLKINDILKASHQRLEIVVYMMRSNTNN
jgi:hypothetical protein